MNLALREQLLGALQHDNILAFLRVLRQGESSQDDDKAYRIVVGGQHFDGDLSAHPRIAVKTKWGWSSAFGAYQIMAAVEGKVKTDTYDWLARELGPSMEPVEQDLKAVRLIQKAGALEAAMEGRLDEAVNRCAKTWASLPGSPYGQPTQTLKDCREIFAAYGGRETGSSSSPVSRPADPPTTQDVAPSAREGNMAPLVLPLLEIAASLIPQLGKMFGSGTEVSNRNVAAASIVADSLVKATQAVNLQDAVERIQNDPQALQNAKQAVSDVMFQIGEAGGGGIAGARTANASPDQAPLTKRGDFWISGALFSLVFLLLIDFLFVHPSNYDGNLRTQVVTAILVVIGLLGAYWLGSTSGSSRKTELLAAK